MSVRQMGLVWELDLPHNQAWVLMALLDHADHNGERIYPGLKLIAHKTGYQLRQVQRIVRSLEEAGILEVVTESTQHRPTEYRARLDHVPRKQPYSRDDKMSPLNKARDDKKTPLDDVRDDKMSPLSNSRDDILSSRDDIAMSSDPSWEPSDPTPLPPTANAVTPAAPAGGGGGGGQRAERRTLPGPRRTTTPTVCQESVALLRGAGATSAAAIAEAATLSPDVVRAKLAEAPSDARNAGAWAVKELQALARNPELAAAMAADVAPAPSRPPPKRSAIATYPGLSPQERDRYLRQFAAAPTPAAQHAIIERLRQEHPYAATD